MKRFLSAALAAAMAVSLVACGGTTSAPAGSTPVSYTHLDVYKRQIMGTP